MVFFQGLFLLGLFPIISAQVDIYKIPIEIDANDDCHLRIKICSDGLHADSMYFEINNNRIVTDDCDFTTTRSNEGLSMGPGSQNFYYMFAISGSCRLISYMDVYRGVSFDEDDWIENVYDTLHNTPYGGYFVMLSRGGFQQEIFYISNSSSTHATKMDDLGFLWDSEDYFYADLKSVNDYDFGDATEQNDTKGDPALAVVYQKGVNGKRLLKTIGAGHSARYIDLDIANTDFCIEPLGPMDQVKHDSSVYGYHDQLEESVFPSALHIDYGNLIGCNGTVYGWEFIPANDEEDVVFVIGYDEDQNIFKITGKHRIFLQDSVITKNLEINYVCHRNAPILNVGPGFWYGYMTLHDNIKIAPPLKIVFPLEKSEAQYPCSRQFTWGEASKILIMDIDDTDGYSFNGAATNTEVYGAMALRPIMDEDFMYHCGCSRDQDCHEYQDFNMVCVSDVCKCRENYVFNRRHNRCLFAEIPYEEDFSVYQSSLLDSLDMWEAEGAVDGDSEAHILNGTCSMTQEGANPWFVLDLGMETMVYGVEITTPIPLDVYLVGWETITNPAPNPLPEPDCFLHDDYYEQLNATTHCGVDTLQRIDVHGPFPWLIQTLDESDFEILNREYQDGVTTYYYDEDTGSNMGSVGIQTQRVTRIVDFGYIQYYLDSYCWQEIEDVIYKLRKSVGDECEGIVIYIEQASGDEDDYYIRRLNDSFILQVDSFTVGAQAKFGAGSTSFKFFHTMYNAVQTDFRELYNQVLIRPTNDISKCLKFDGADPAVLRLSDSSCDEVYLHEMFDETLPMYKYRQEVYIDEASTPPYQSVNITKDDEGHPCYEIFAAKNADLGTVSHVVENKWIYLAAHLAYDNSNLNYSDPLIFRGNVVGMRDFNIAVGNYFDESSFDVDVFDNYTICNSFKGSPLNGKAFTMECNEPIRGRYVGIYLNTMRSFDKIQLCDFRVHSLKGKAYHSYCSSDLDCDWFRDNATGDQNLACKRGKCVCDNGYVYHTEAEMCVDIDECRLPLINEDPSGLRKCQIDPSDPSYYTTGTCVNQIGSYTCDCPDGYYYESLERDEDFNVIFGKCRDIDEEIRLLCDCEGICQNRIPSFDGYPYVCICPPGFRLARDGKGCEDVDECSYVQEFRGECDEGSTAISSPDLERCLTLCAEIDCHVVASYPGGCTIFTDCENYFATTDPGYTLYFRRMEREATQDMAQCLYDYQLSIELGLTSADEYPQPVGCVNSVGSYDCICPAGYNYTDKNCINLNECPGLCEDGCNDQEPMSDGGRLYVCDCDGLDGYELGGDGYSCIDTDECEEENNCTSSVSSPSADRYLDKPVQQKYQAYCKNTVGSYHCECPVGFYYDHVNNWCYDIDECDSPLRIHECEDICINLFGSYKCNCHDGYTLSLNDHSCEDINECTENTHECGDGMLNFPSIVSGACHNEIGYFICTCPEGYFWLNGACYDINECTTLKDDPCEDRCENRYRVTGLFYECFCDDPGYRLSNNSRTCVDIDECYGINTCVQDDKATCFNTIGSYYCVCIEGYTWDIGSTACEDVNECNTNYGLCTDICTNMIGSYRCSCEVGFELTSNQHTCEDTDECLDNTHLCSDICTNTEGSYTCSCYKGRTLTGDRLNCIDINECFVDNGGCEHRCTNTMSEDPATGPVPGVTCSCFQGHRLLADYRGCVDIDECLKPADNQCAKICHNTIGSYTCSCLEGYKLHPDKKNCLDIDECVEEKNGGCMTKCTNTEGSFQCSCNSGFSLDGNRRTCTDIDECKDNNGDCEHICHNSPGSYKCACNGPNVLLNDGFTCSAFNVLEMRGKVNLPYIEQYSDTSSPEYKALKQWLELNFAELCRDVQLRSMGITSCEIVGPFFPTTELSAQLVVERAPIVPITSGQVAPPSNQGQPVRPSRPGTNPRSDRSQAASRTHHANTLADRRKAMTADRVQYEGFEGSLLGFDVAIKSEDVITSKEQGELSFIVTNLLMKNGNSLVINGTKVQLIDDPLFINVQEDGSENIFTVKSPCDFFVETFYCMNGAKCEVVQDSPVCDCVDGFTGSRCDVKPSTVLKTKDIVIYSALIALGVICVFLAIGLCYMLLRKTDNIRLHREPAVHFPDPPSISWRNSYGDYFK